LVGISVIIPTLNEEAYIGKTLAALKSQLEKGDEVIVVDSYSKDNTLKIAKRFGARVVSIPRCGIGPAKTFGARKAKNKIIAMLDADGAPKPDWIDRIKKHFENKDIDAVTGLDLYDGSNRAKTFVYLTFSWIVFNLGKLNYFVTKVPWMAVNNCAIKKNIFFKYGGLKNVVCEDFDLAQRSKGMSHFYDIKMRVTLSDRRFKAEGFVKTVLLWIKSDIAIFRNKNKIAATDYSVIRKF
jgi:glycosyltransferase involved in cell wall biosynthesis